MPKSAAVEIEVERPVVKNPNDQVDLYYEKKGKDGQEPPAEIGIRWNGKIEPLHPGESLRVTRLCALKQLQIAGHKTLDHNAKLSIRELKAVSAMDGSAPLSRQDLEAAAAAEGLVLVDKAHLAKLEAKDKHATTAAPKVPAAAGPTKAELRVQNEAKAKELGIAGYKDLSNPALLEAITKAEAEKASANAGADKA